MEEVIGRLLVECGYVKRNPADPNFCDAYFNHDLNDCVIVCEYNLENLANFNESKKTKIVMQIFEEAKQNADIFKNTSLVIPLKLNSFSDYAFIQNLILSVEENPYAFRKYIALYTSEGFKDLEASEGLKKKLETILLDSERFKNFEEDKPDEEFRTILELFVKLPFMGVRGIPSVELPEYISPLDEPDNAELKNIFTATKELFEEPIGLSLDEQIEELLKDELVDKFASNIENIK